MQISLISILFPALAATFCMFIKFFFEKKLSWGVFFVGHILMIISIIISFYQYLFFRNSSIKPEGLKVENFFDLGIGYIVILIISIVMVERNCWDKETNEISKLGNFLLLLFGFLSLFFLLFLIQETPVEMRNK